MMNELREQAERFGTKVEVDFISRVEFSKEKGGTHKIYTQNGDEIKSKAIIICTGASAKYLGIPSEQKLIGGGVSACAVCDGFFYKGQDVAVVGGGDSAIITLQGQNAILYSENILNKYFNDFWHKDTEIHDKLGIKVKNNITNEISEIKVAGLFLAIGHTPNTDIFKGIINMDESGYILTDKTSTKTNIPGVFAAGDVQDKDYRQAITAAGTGCMAALDAERYLQEI